MELTFNPHVAYKGERAKKVKKDIENNSTEMQIAGGTGFVLTKAPKISQSVMTVVQKSKAHKMQKEKQIFKIISKCKPLAKFAGNPVFGKCVSIFAGASALTAFAGSIAKVADTYDFLNTKSA